MLYFFIHSLVSGDLAFPDLGLIDGEVMGNGYRIALEIKTSKGDVTRALGQLTEAVAFGYDDAALVTPMYEMTK